MVKPKHGKYECPYCREVCIEGAFLPTDTVWCYLCGNQMLVKDLVRLVELKEVQVKPLNDEVTGAFVEYDYGPDANGQMKVSDITFNGVPYIYRGKRI